MAVLNLLPFGSSWQEFKSQEPRYAAQVRERFDSFTHHVLATVSHDGSPRVSGTEVFWIDDRLIFGAQTGSRKASDLTRDPRVALHSNPGDGTMKEGDYKLNGRVVVLSGPQLDRIKNVLKSPPSAILYEMRISHVACTQVINDQLDIQLWTPAKGLVQVQKT